MDLGQERGVRSQGSTGDSPVSAFVPEGTGGKLPVAPQRDAAQPDE